MSKGSPLKEVEALYYLIKKAGESLGKIERH